MMKKVLILHGWGGSDEPHWQWWLEKELIKKNYQVSFPNFPKRDLPDFKEWIEVLKEEYNKFQPDIVVCHSLANILWFHFANAHELKELDKLMLVAPVRKTCDIEELKSFFPYPVPKKLNAKEIIMVGSTNDPYLSVEEAIELHAELNIGLKILDDAGHINADSGFGELSCAVDWIERECEESKTK
ncbi:alpha/beta hydrolase [Arcobacteraceae bacterium]|nr:alpha/beta hydrolase [Arcobacteraceae bacterium]